MSEELKGSFEDLAKEATDIIIEALLEFMHGAEDDLKAYTVEIGKSVLSAIQSGDKDRLEELKNQIKVLAEIHRIHLNGVAWEAVEKVLNAAFLVAIALLKRTTGEIPTFIELTDPA